MCAIVGLVGPLAAVSWAVKGQRALHVLTPRGPDGAGVHVDCHVALGVRRLSINDAIHGGQPMYSDDGRVVLIANAEIYNHRILRRQLERRGYIFKSGSDCEVMVHLYREHGIELVNKLNGPFAFALLDRATGELWLARDRLGEKPLFYSRTAFGVAFASELKALIAGGFVRPRVNEQALMEYLKYQYVPEPETLLHAVYHLPAGHYAQIEVPSGHMRMYQYWSVDVAAVTPPDDWADWLVEHLRREGTQLACADAEMGVSLSGGLDSAIAARVLTQSHPTPHAFCVGYTGTPRIDERKRAAETASALGLNLMCLQLTPDSVDTSFEDLAVAVDQPVADLAGPSYYALARAASAKDVRVLLYGHGGDELTMGYGWLQRARQALLARPDTPLCRCHFYAYNEAVCLAIKVAPRIMNTDALTQFKMGTCGHEGPAVGDADIRRCFTKLLVTNYLQSNGVAQTERISAAHGVEIRLPLVDHRVVGRLMSVQTDHGSGLDKQLLRSALNDWLPGQVGRRRKTPFLTPSRAWHVSLLPKRRERIIYGQLRACGIFKPGGLEELAHAPVALGAGTSLTYKVLLFETWWNYLTGLMNRPMTRLTGPPAERFYPP
ncbi:MAG: asparagine synthase (glutamine-hydrolyzing) [Pseudonocardiaceae bacterium]